MPGKQVCGGLGGWKGVLAPALLAVLAVVGGTRTASASVTVLVEEPYGDLAKIAPTGHAAVYVDRLCAETPTRLRPCRVGEAGAVLARYNGVGDYDWIAIPLVPYLYAVDSSSEIPQYADEVQVAALRERYRLAHLTSVAPDSDSSQYKNWYELAGSAYDRTLYGFTVPTSEEADLALMAKLNDSPNRSVYNGAFRNCADFVREVVNFYYPHAIVRNKAADLFMTTPKQLSHGLTLYTQRHGVALTTNRIEQVQGAIPRSVRIKGATECLVTCRRYVVPLTLMGPYLTAAAATSYLLQGRFKMPKEAPAWDFSAYDDSAATPAYALRSPSADGSSALHAGWVKTHKEPAE